jgi:hypothetical protein
VIPARGVTKYTRETGGLTETLSHPVLDNVFHIAHGQPMFGDVTYIAERIINFVLDNMNIPHVAITGGSFPYYPPSFQIESGHKARQPSIIGHLQENFFLQSQQSNILLWLIANN